MNMRTTTGGLKSATITLFTVLVICMILGPVLLAQEMPRPFLPFEKTNRILLDVGDPGKFDSTQAKYPCVLRVDDEWWMWYNGRTDDRFTGSIGLATSVDGLTWTKENNGNPVFDHGARGTFDATKVDHPAVLHFDGNFHMWYTAGDRNSRYRIGYATSSDGLHWQRENTARPVLGAGESGRFDDQVVLHPAVVRDKDGLLHMWYNGVGPQKSFRVGHATSLDGVHWKRQNQGRAVLEPGLTGDFREEYVYNVFVRLADNRFHMWYSSWTSDNRTTEPKHNCIIHAVSDNGNDWKKDATPSLCNGGTGSIDEYAAFACCIVPRDDEFWMYYSAGSGTTNGQYRVALAKCPSSE